MERKKYKNAQLFKFDKIGIYRKNENGIELKPAFKYIDKFDTIVCFIDRNNDIRTRFYSTIGDFYFDADNEIELLEEIERLKELKIVTLNTQAQHIKRLSNLVR